MRAVLLTRYGGREVLRIRDIPEPQPRQGEVRVRIKTIGINFAEILSRRGLYGWAPRLPYVPGMEAFGVVEGTGQRVIVGTQFGTYAESICVPEERVLPAPESLSDDECAAFAVSYLTAWIGLMEMARLRPTDTLLVTSAAGGVGSAAVQLGARLGARVIGAAGAGKQDIVRKLGAETALDYSSKGWEAGVRADVVLEMTGGDVYRAALRSVAPMGRVVIAGASDAFPRTRNPLARLAALRNLPRASIFDMLRRSYGVMSFHVGWLLDAGQVHKAWADLVRFTNEHGIRPLVDRTYAFEEIADAHRLLEERRNLGKVLVRVG
jgi:synaptic vesicle membrane protein VAT-1